VILCVDAGNTAIKLAVLRGSRVVRQTTITTDAGERESARACARVLRGVERLEAAALSSVRPRVTEALVRAIVRASGFHPTVVNHRTPMPIAIGVRHPSRVGTDRLCAACGAVAGRRRDAIVVTVGSAITVNLVRDRVFLGGIIMPGPATSLAALHAFTAQLPKLDFDAPMPARIDDTESAMRWGAAVASAGGIRLAVEMLDARVGSRPTRFVTGGYADRIGRWLPKGWKRVPDLTLLGLATIARYDIRK
jgi:type III pantothenate kinase